MAAALPAPPMAGRIFFESPIMAPAVAFVVLIAGVAMCLNGGKGIRAVVVGCVGVAVVVGLAASSRLVTTPREQIEAQTMALVDAIATGDAQAVEDMLSKRLMIKRDGAEMAFSDPRQFLIDELENVSALIESHSRRTVASITDSKLSGRVRFSVRTSIQGGGMNFTVWQGEWRRDPDDTWRLYVLDWKKLNGQEPHGRDFFRARGRNI